MMAPLWWTSSWGLPLAKIVRPSARHKGGIHYAIGLDICLGDTATWYKTDADTF